MASMVGKFAAKKLMAGQLEKHKKKDAAGPYDPYYARIENRKRPGRFKKVKKQIPDYIPENDARILAKTRRRAYLLDCCLFNIFGIRFGWSSVIGIIPAIGDAFEVILALMLFKACLGVKGGLTNATKAHMLFNIIVDFGVGLIPFVGDLADAAYKCNSKNVRLLEEHLDKKYKPDTVRKRHKEQARLSGLVEYPPATEFEDFEDEEEERRAAMTAGNREESPARQEPRRPDPARVSKPARGEPQRSGTSRWMGGGDRTRPSNTEMQETGTRPAR
ncbi:hypothetical protein P152DRAFT_447213 [Eremomyces bilateralis CBS 781.70]|uniref:PH domain-containing protein n=1 Tax=Eremomyces bilateralis CBS 781.70 TaxID=1392243 RepID=A0A6G1GA18_9PEZI|nr:uncharacterized protein P152DRAFT_447213 [Eremomyces bilateralis CBS 781.70]KAF1814927.1 hypothetical protein P152DRAFT_447213 [Eremomyces bilateralis CBS 781.70]